MKFSFSLKPLQDFGTKMRKFSDAMPSALEHNDRAFADKLMQSVIRHASGRPGPNIVTGQYVSSFMVDRNNKVINPSPQTARLEYGYQGVDRAGRSYDQPPFPHFRPALVEVRPEYVRGIVEVIRKTWRAS